MRNFVYQSAASVEDAVKAKGAGPVEESAYLAGGTTLIDLMKLNVVRPARVVDINDVERFGQYGKIQVTANGLYLGGLVRMADAARHPDVLRLYPVIAQTLQMAASPQLRNMATLAGNVLQRTRCTYFRDTSWSQCNKRNPGSGCAALTGVNRQHAVIGDSDACIATYPGDFAQALMVLDAKVEITGAQGRRTIPFAGLHRSPGLTPNIETTLDTADFITGFTIPAAAWTRRSLYVKVRDRQSYAFALASSAIALDIDQGVVREARIAVGGVATVPWRAHAAEAALKGKRIDQASAATAAEAAFSDARARQDNAYKIPLGKATIVRALLQAVSIEV